MNICCCYEPRQVSGIADHAWWVSFEPLEYNRGKESTIEVEKGGNLYMKDENFVG